MNITNAKQAIREALRALGLSNKVTARTIDFTDLARQRVIFVKVHDWNPNPAAIELEALGQRNGFRIEFSGTEFV